MSTPDNQLFLRYLEACGFSLYEVSDYQWRCYPGAKYYDCVTAHGTASLLADISRGIVYEIHVVREETHLTHLQLNTMLDPFEPLQGYRWVHEGYRAALREETAERGQKFGEFDVDCRYYDTDCVEDILEKCRCIMAGEPWDHTVVMSFDIEDELREQVLAAAARMGITENEFYVRALTAVVEDHKAKE